MFNFSHHIAYTVENIKFRIPLILDMDMDELNYDIWCELFRTHCGAYGVRDHIDDTHTTPPTDDDWKMLDHIVKCWIYNTINLKLLQNILAPDITARQAWLNIKELFRTKKDARALLLQEDSRLDDYFTESSASDDTVSTPSILVDDASHPRTSPSYRPDGRRSTRRQGRRSYSTGSPQYGWIYVHPPPSSVVPQPPAGHHYAPPHQPSRFSSPQQQLHSAPHQPYSAPPLPSSAPPGSYSNQPPQSYYSQPHATPTVGSWMGTDQPTSLPHMYDTVNLRDPHYYGWIMDTGATDHIHADSALPTVDSLR